MLPFFFCYLYNLIYRLKKETYERFQQLTRKESLLSDVFRQSLSFDLLSPLLTEDHIMSMDRRLNTVIRTVDKCIEDHGVENVLVDSIPMETETWNSRNSIKSLRNGNYRFTQWKLNLTAHKSLNDT